MSEARRPANRYSQLIEDIFHRHYQEGLEELYFARDEIIQTAEALGIDLPKNVGDVLYTFRYRARLPESIRQTETQSHEWVIRPAGRGQYCFALTSVASLVPSMLLAETKIPDATPGIIAKYSLNDEQALLAKLRYNRLIDVFIGITCYSLQNHLRTSVPGLGQVETDELYVGVDRRGVQYVIPVEAKASREQLGVVQVEQDLALCQHKFPSLVCVPVAAQFMEDQLIALFAFELTDIGIAVSQERHYRLVPPADVTLEDLDTYRARPQQ